MNSMRNYINLILEADMPLSDAIHVFSKFGVKNANSLSKEDLKLKYKQLVRKYHPDLNGGDSHNLAFINSAYDTLKNNNSQNNFDDEIIKKYYQDRQRQQQNSRQEIPVWVWAGYSGGTPPSSNIYKNNYTDLNYCKKHLWELSNHSKEEWTIMNFDGHFFRGSFTVFGSPAIFNEMAKAMIIWDNFNKSRAIFVLKKSSNDLLLIYSDGRFHNPPYKFVFGEDIDSFNKNPGNDQQFIRKLPQILDDIDQEE